MVAAGGKLVAKRGGDDFSWITLTDPEGNPLDIYASGQEEPLIPPTGQWMGAP